MVVIQEPVHLLVDGRLRCINHVIQNYTSLSCSIFISNSLSRNDCSTINANTCLTPFDSFTSSVFASCTRSATSRIYCSCAASSLMRPSSSLGSGAASNSRHALHLPVPLHTRHLAP